MSVNNLFCKRKGEVRAPSRQICLREYLMKLGDRVIANEVKQSSPEKEIASSPEFILSEVEGAPRNDSPRPLLKQPLRITFPHCFIGNPYNFATFS